MAAGDRAFWSDVDEAIARPSGRLVQTVTQTGIASATTTALTFTTEDLDSHNFHNTGVNPSRVTPTVAGWYNVRGGVAYAGATDYIANESFIRQNGLVGIPPGNRITPSTASQTLVVPCAAKVFCNGTTDYFEVCLRATKTAGTIATVISSQYTSTLEWDYDRPA
jgi:hypothetical protein